MKKKKDSYIKLAGVSGAVKKFNQDLFNKYDPEARAIIKEKLGIYTDPNPDIYGEDMLLKDEELSKYCNYLEIQVFSKWDESKFPYKFPFIYARKMRFSKKTLFITFNKYLTEIIMFSRNKISEKAIRLEKYSREFIHIVPWRYALRMYVDKLSINDIRAYYGIYSEDEIQDKVQDEISIPRIKIIEIIDADKCYDERYTQTLMYQNMMNEIWNTKKN